MLQGQESVPDEVDKENPDNRVVQPEKKTGITEPVIKVYRPFNHFPMKWDPISD